MSNNKMHNFQINVLIQILVSSTCFEHHVLIIRMTICTCSYFGCVFHAKITISLSACFIVPYSYIFYNFSFMFLFG